MTRRPPRSTRTDTLFPYTTLFRSVQLPACPALLTIWTTPLRSPAGAGRRHAMTHLPSPEWRVSPDLTDYPPALADMEQRAAAIHAGEANERIWLLEPPPL